METGEEAGVPAGVAASLGLSAVVVINCIGMVLDGSESGLARVMPDETVAVGWRLMSGLPEPELGVHGVGKIAGECSDVKRAS